MGYYPALLQVRERRCVVLGGDAAAADKVEALRGCGARVDVIDPQPGERLLVLAAGGEIRLQQRDYRPGDLAGAFLAVCCRRERALVDAVAREAARRNVPLNVLDEPRDCTFIAPAVVRRGDLIVAISTSGHAPALAVRLRQQLEALLGEHHAAFLEIAARLRKPMARHHPAFAERRARWYRIVDSDVLELLRRGEHARARERVGEIVGFALDGELPP
jgi:siroheme synthase-like protein